MNNIEIRRAESRDLEIVANLFDSYRQFYGQLSDLEGVRKFLCERLNNEDSVIFLAFINNQVSGFVQLYPSFSSVSMRKVWILNDMLVLAHARKKGVGTALLKFVKQFASETEAKSVILETAPENKVARQLYETNGYIQDTKYLHYALLV